MWCSVCSGFRMYQHRAQSVAHNELRDSLPVYGLIHLLRRTLQGRKRHHHISHKALHHTQYREMNFSRLIYYLHNPQELQFALALRYPKLFSDKQYLKILFRKLMGSELNLECPQTFSEKLQWLKLYDHNPQYT